MKRNVIPALKKGILPISLLTTYQYLSQKTIRQDDSEQLVSIQVDSSSLEEGQMIEVKVGPKDDDNVLLSRVDNTLHCVSNKCTHFGAPLAKGLLVEDRVLCPWHAAAFSVKTGAPEYGPVLDGLQVF
jgi:nitrite reductase/ring-hydroxylating ferredoxin subunit